MLGEDERVFKIGDVIKSERFILGYLGEYIDFRLDYLNLQNIVRVGGADNIIDEVRIDEDERVRQAALTGKIPPKVIKDSHRRNDPSRASASYVIIERTRMDSEEGTAYIDVIIAQRLLENGCYDPEGERIWFFYYKNNPDEGIKVIRKMRLMFE